MSERREAGIPLSSERARAARPQQAEVAVRRAHGDIEGGEPTAAQSDIAGPEDAEAVREERSD